MSQANFNESNYKLQESEQNNGSAVGQQQSDFKIMDGSQQSRVMSRGIQSRDQSNENSQQAQANNIPGTSSSQKRQLPFPNSQGQNIARAGVVRQSQQKKDFIPIQTGQYSSQRDNVLAQNNQKRESSRIENQEQKISLQGFKPLNTAQAGEGGLGVISPTINMRTSQPGQDMAKDEYHIQTFNELSNNNLKFCTKSKSNINLQQTGQQHHSINQAVTQIVYNNPNDPEGKFSKQKIQMKQHHLQTQLKRQSQSNNETSPVNQGMLIQNTVIKSSDANQNIMPPINHFKTNPIPNKMKNGSGEAVNRKMSLAAKSGQMQIFNKINHQNLNNGVHIQLGSNQITTQQQMETHFNYNANQVPLPGKQNESISQNSSLNNIPPKQTLASNAGINPRQIESYLGRRHIIQQQREKKHELLKQLDHGRHGADQMQNYNNNMIKTEPIQENNKLLSQNKTSHIYSSVQTNYADTSNTGAGTQNSSRAGAIWQTSSSQNDRQMNSSAKPVSQEHMDFMNKGRFQQRGDQTLDMESSRRKNIPQSYDANNVTGSTMSLIIKQNQLQSNAVNASYIQNVNMYKKEGNQQIQEVQIQNDSNIGSFQMPQISGIALTVNQQQQLQPNYNPSEERYIKQQQDQIQETNIRNKDLQKINQQVSNEQQQIQVYKPKQEYPNAQGNINSRITRKLEGGRPHKVYDYMFIQMSNEQFKQEYSGRKIIVQSHEKDDEVSRRQNQIQNYQNTIENGKYGKKQFMSPSKTPGKGMNSYMNSNSSNLNGLVKIRAYDSQVTDELPLMQCNLLPTQLDHVKLLICEQDDKNYPKLTPDAQNRFEIEKQNQIKQYMEDIIQKLQQKDRKFKVTVKKKFVDDALYNSTSIRVASVYVIVVNREKTYDPFLNQKFFKARKRISDNAQAADTSEDDEDQDNTIRKDGVRLIANANLIAHGKKRSMYDSDTNGGLYDGMNSTSASSNVPQFKKLIFDKNSENEKGFKSAKGRINSNEPGTFKRMKKVDDSNTPYKYQPLVKEFSKYKPTTIKICQNVNTHNHHISHPLNIFFNQYNEFVRLIFKNKTSVPQPGQKFNFVYALGLSRALGLNLKKDAFSEQNLKSRDHINQLKEKLIFIFYKKIFEENRDLTPNLHQSQVSDTGSNIDLDETDNTTPKSKRTSVSLNKESSEQVIPVNIANVQMAYPHPQVNYKYFIGKGNNSIMVRSLFKNRYWWVQNESDNCNYVWTQNKVQRIMDSFPCKYPNKKSGIKNNGTAKKQQTQLLQTPQNKQKKQNGKKLNSDNKMFDQKGNKIPPEPVGIKSTEERLYNKIEDNFHMNNKKALFLNMKNYYEALDEDVFANLPLTFHIKNGLEDPEFQKFQTYYQKCEEDVKNRKAQLKQKRQDAQEKVEQTDASPQNSPSKTENNVTEPTYYQSQATPKNIWIIKPGENTNRGQGIQVAREFSEIKEIIYDSTLNRKRTCIVQKYIHNPLLFNRRKFDIRTYALMVSVNGNLKAYLYEEGYLRTSCREYSINNLNNKLVHLTNDAVQKRSEDYGKFEPGNKLSYSEFQMYLDKTYPDQHICFERDLIPQMNKLTIDVFRACHGKLDPKRRLNTMEVFGLDFMICDEFRPYLIEVNTNPCLELASPLLARLIPTMLENALKIAADSHFIPPENFSVKKSFIGDPCPENRFSLCFDDKIDGPVLDKIFATKNNIISKQFIFI